MANIKPSDVHSFSDYEGNEGATPLKAIDFTLYDSVFPATKLFEIIGHESQVLEINMPPGQKVIAEPGTLLHMTEHITRKVGSGGLMKAAARAMVAGESFFRVMYENPTSDSQIIGLTPNFPSKIIPIDLNVYSGITIKSGAFMCAIGENAKLSYRLAGSVAAACCAGQGAVLNSLNGTGVAFLNASGTVVSKTLKDGEVILLDSYSLVAFTSTVAYDVRRVGGCKMCCLGGESCFNVVVRGPGLIILQTFPFEKFASLIFPGGNGGGGDGGGGGGGGGA